MGRALSARSTSRPKAATRTMSPARGIVAGSTGIIEMSNGRPTMRNYLDRMHDQTLAHVASLSNSDILSKSPDEWVAQLVQEFASPEIPVLDLTKISRTAEQGEVPAYAVPNPKFSTHVLEEASNDQNNQSNESDTHQQHRERHGIIFQPIPITGRHDVQPCFRRRFFLDARIEGVPHLHY